MSLEQSSQPKSVAKQQKDQPSAKSQTAQSVDEAQSKQARQFLSRFSANEPQSSQEGLNLISSLTDVEPPKQTVNQSPTDETVSSRVQKNSKRRGSASSTGTLSDIIQDIKISPREAKMAADSMPTKGTHI